jgi:hypothetical protein
VAPVLEAETPDEGEAGEAVATAPGDVNDTGTAAPETESEG